MDNIQKLTAMNSQSEESFQIEDSPQLPIRQAQPGRSRFTLLSDIAQTTNSTKPNLQQSPVRMYLRELHEQRLLLEKQNMLKQGNRKELYPENRPQKDRKQITRPIHEGEKKKNLINHQNNQTREYIPNKSQKIAYESIKQDNDRRMKPGIYLYKKKINLAEPAQSWSDLGESFLRSSHGSRTHYNGDFQSQGGLFQEALKYKNLRR